jgi:drug/metabolite transporter (DMT)-like permease
LNRPIHHPTLRDWAALLVLTLLWGSAYAFIKHAVISFPPAALIFVRISVAAALLTAWTYARGHRLPPLNDTRWLWFGALGLFGNTLPFFLISWGQQTIDSALTGILIATMPLTTIALAHVFVPGEQMNARRLAGFLLGFAGVVVLLGPVALGGLGGTGLIAQIGVLCAAVCYGINAVLARLLPDTPPSLSGAGMLIMAALLALPFGAWDLAHMPVAPASAWMMIVWLAVGPTAFASVLLMQIARTAGPSFLATVNYMTPIAAVATGLMIGETIGWNALLALMIILAGVWLARKKVVVPPV